MIPFFSIITATYNAEKHLPRLLESLAGQTCRDFELVVQDGASTDGTLAIIESYRGRLPGLSLKSEPDTGIYDAWNKAVARASGEWVLFLGADDALANPVTLQKAAAILTEVPPVILFAVGGLRQFFANGILKEHICGCCTDVRETLPFGMCIPFPALFLRSDIVRKYPFSTRYSIAGDYDLLCKVWKTDAAAIVLNFDITDMLATGISCRPEKNLQAFMEARRIQQKHFPPAPVIFVVTRTVKAWILHCIVKLFGPIKAPKILNTIRKWRGLPPRWDAGE